jgi:aminoglycoside phosphotransferase (APT) family kinase protein
MSSKESAARDRLVQAAAAQQALFSGRTAADRGRDFEDTARRLADWLTMKTAAESLATVSDLRYPQGAGISNETILFHASWRANGMTVSNDLVVRLHPGNQQLFLEPAFEQQYRLIELIGRNGWVKVPKVCWLESDPTVLGRPFFVMQRVLGKVPVTFPNYNVSGFLVDATSRERERAWRSAMTQFAAIHRVSADEVHFLHRPQFGPTGFEDEFQYWKRSLEWSAEGNVPPACALALEWLDRNLPDNPEDGLSWGDARIGNMIFGSDFEVAAVVDWEQASLGGRLQDLGWWLLFDELCSTAIGVKRLDGLGNYSDTIALWRELTGQRERDLDWYRFFAAYKCAVVTIKTYRLRAMSAPGNNPGNNLATRWICNFLDVAPPADMN